MPQFAAVLGQLEFHNKAPLASHIRQSMESVGETNVAPWYGCSVSPKWTSQVTTEIEHALLSPQGKLGPQRQCLEPLSEVLRQPHGLAMKKQ